MAFQVDQCKHFKDGKKCSKCERMMPAYCKDQQDLEEKARLYDEWVASQQPKEEVEDVVNETDEVSIPSQVVTDSDVVVTGDSGGKPKDAATKPKATFKGKRPVRGRK